MTALSTIPPAGGSTHRADLTHTFRAMASNITVRLGAGTRRPADAVDAVVEVFTQVERACTRFDPDSALMRANAAGDSWCAVGPYCFAAVAEAAQAHDRTEGLFDPRVLRTLVALGYSRSMAFGPGGVDLEAGDEPGPGPAPGRWRPGLDAGRRAVRVGPIPIDLGGIGKGLAVRWAADRIVTASDSFFIEAGGDCYFAGAGPDLTGWLVGVEDPAGGPDPVAVLRAVDMACATSSTRIRHWTVAGRSAHHLIDPRTGEPGAGGLRSVTVLDPDPAAAEIWSKTLFLHGRAGIADVAAAQRVAAVWVGEWGELGVSADAEPALAWRAT